MITQEFKDKLIPFNKKMILLEIIPYYSMIVVPIFALIYIYIGTKESFGVDWIEYNITFGISIFCIIVAPYIYVMIYNFKLLRKWSTHFKDLDLNEEEKIFLKIMKSASYLALCPFTLVLGMFVRISLRGILAKNFMTNSLGAIWYRWYINEKLGDRRR